MIRKGRPCKPPAARRGEAVLVRLTADEHEALRVLAKAAGVGVAGYMRERAFEPMRGWAALARDVRRAR